MLSPSNRLTSPVHFREVVRRGRRSGGPLMVVHFLVPSIERAPSSSDSVPIVGFVVSKAVGNAVARNLVKRRLRHLARERTVCLPPRGMLVVRALPPAADASYDELARELDRCLARVDVAVDISVGVGVSG